MYGVTVWETLARRKPWAAVSPQTAALAVLGGRRPSVPAFAPPALAAVMQGCWRAEPGDRPSMAEVMVQLATLRRQLDRELSA